MGRVKIFGVQGLVLVSFGLEIDVFLVSMDGAGSYRGHLSSSF